METERVSHVTYKKKTVDLVLNYILFFLTLKLLKVIINNASVNR